jgi:anti-sigma factor RsiW
MSACGHDPLMIQAFVDGELDAIHAAEIEARIEACADCKDAYARLTALRQTLRAPGVRVAAPERLRERLRASLAAAAAEPAAASATVTPLGARRPKPWAWMGGGAGMAIAACAALFVIAGQSRQEQLLTDDLIASHVRSLQVAHLTDVATSDQHVVKPWFAGKLDFSPPVVELKDRGFALVGGRLDYVAGRTVAAIVYRRGRHFINVFVWPADAEGDAEQLRRGQGYELRRWRAAGMTYWAVSDVNPTDLALFESLYKVRALGPRPAESR